MKHILERFKLSGAQDGEASLKARCTSSQVSQFLMHFDTAAGSSIDQTNWKTTATTIDTGIKWPDLHVW